MSLISSKLANNLRLQANHQFVYCVSLQFCANKTELIWKAGKFYTITAFYLPSFIQHIYKENGAVDSMINFMNFKIENEHIIELPVSWLFLRELCMVLRRTSKRPAFPQACSFIMRCFLEQMYLGKGRVLGVAGASGCSVEVLMDRFYACHQLLLKMEVCS